MPSMSGWALRLLHDLTDTRPTGLVSMPSMSGWALRLTFTIAGYSPHEGRFLCPRCRAGLCDRGKTAEYGAIGLFLCPRCRAGLCDLLPATVLRVLRLFLCPRCRAGLCDIPALFSDDEAAEIGAFLCPRCRAGLCDKKNISRMTLTTKFLCPRCRAGLCDNARSAWEYWEALCFYALDVGLGFATVRRRS